MRDSPDPRPPTPVRPGFALLELIAALAIIAVLCGIVISLGQRASTAAKRGRAVVELAAVAAALEEYRRQHGDYPRTDDPAQLLQALLGRRTPGMALSDRPPILESARYHAARADMPAIARDPRDDLEAVLIDPWEQPYRYHYRSLMPWHNPGYVLYSCGPDRSEAPALVDGGWLDREHPGNADNLYPPGSR